MHPAYLGDSYDIVKRFFCEALCRLGYTVYIDPMFTGEWSGQETAFYRFLGVEQLTSASAVSSSTALFLDPDTGVNRKGSRSHVSYERIVGEAQKHKIVFAFDQGFSRGMAPEPQIREKIEAIAALGCSAIYYNSHARFLFVSRAVSDLHTLRDELVSRGLPGSRFIEAAPNSTVERDARKSGARPSP
jgi:hypothetical protein